jgi:hypothetical protein
VLDRIEPDWPEVAEESRVDEDEPEPDVERVLDPVDELPEL